jgi:hypothetical protein
MVYQVLLLVVSYIRVMECRQKQNTPKEWAIRDSFPIEVSDGTKEETL